MQMNPYPLNRVLSLLSAHSFHELVVLTDIAAGFESALILGRKVQ
jgi:hypothetical protein